MIYTIKKGNHSANGLNFGIHPNGKTVSKTVIFHPNCQYDLGNSNQADINKLYGFSVGLFNDNQHNSARFGWRYDRGIHKIELLAYVYVNGVRIQEAGDNIHMLYADSLQPVFTQISVIGNQYVFQVGTEYAYYKDYGGKVIKSFLKAGSGPGYNQYPYFGGNEVAPHDMTIELK